MCSPFGDDTGRVLRTIIESEGVALHAVQMHGSNGAYVHDRRNGERTELVQCPAGELTRHEVDDLYGAALMARLDADVTVLTGPVPGTRFAADSYRRLAIDIRTNGGRVVADLSGEHLHAALEGGVDILKLAAAAGALNVTRSGLGTGHRDEIEQLTARITVQPLAVESAG